MEGDAGTSRLNPIDEDDSPVTQTGTDQVTAEVPVEDSKGSEAGADLVAADETDEAAGESETADTADAADTPDTADAADVVSSEDPEHKGATRGASRLGRGWWAAIAAVLLIVAGVVGGSGYVALRTNQETQSLNRSNALALSRAKECVGVTQAPDTSSMAASEQKIIDCGTDQYRTQALLYTSVLVQAYQAANVHVTVSDLRAAVERTDVKDGTVDVLVAVRIKYSNDEQQNQETGYRLRVRMAPTDGTYKISKLEQVTK